MSVINDEQAQVNWARHVLPVYRAIRRRDIALLDAFLYGLFPAYTDRFRHALCAKLGTPTTDSRDRASLRRWMRTALKMLSDLLLHLHMTEPPSPPADPTNPTPTNPSSSNLPDEVTVSGAKTSLRSARLVREGPSPCRHIRPCVHPVGKSSDTTWQDASMSVERTAASMTTVANAAIVQQVSTRGVSVAEKQESISRRTPPINAPSKMSLANLLLAGDEGCSRHKRPRELDGHQQVTPSKKPCKRPE